MTPHQYIDSLLANNINRIAIVSGEGERGTAELYAGKRTRLALTRKIKKEVCHGDRWAWAVIETNHPDACKGYSVTWSGGADADLGQDVFPNIDD